MCITGHLTPRLIVGCSQPGQNPIAVDFQGDIGYSARLKNRSSEQKGLVYNAVRKLITIVTAVIWLTAGGQSGAQLPPGADSLGLSWAQGYRFFDEPIDPAIYLIRPGEELQVTFIKTKLDAIKLSVDPEGRIVHQTLGVIDLSGKTLLEAQQLLGEALRKLYSVDQMTISVLEPRRVAISVSGAVANPGLYQGYTSQRVSELIEQAGGVEPHGSTRHIVFSGGPGEIRVDLDRAAYLGDNTANPCLYAGYRVSVPGKSRQRINVAGEVNRPRELELVSDDDLAAIIGLAGGARSGADLAGIRVLGRETPGKEGQLRFEAGDIVFVPSADTDASRIRLTVFGAVADPGRYEFREGATVRDLVELAGGFAAGASLGMVTVFRRVRADEWGRATDHRYPVSSPKGGEDKMLAMALQPSDSVYVPFSLGYVKVSGEVRNPGRFPFVEDKDAAYYINAAGGYLPAADRDHVDLYNRIAGTTSSFSPGVLVHDGDELRINLREDLR